MKPPPPAPDSSRSEAPSFLLVGRPLPAAVEVSRILAEEAGRPVRVHEVPDLDGAQAALRRTAWSAALLELDLPDSRGLRTLYRLRRQAPELPIVVLAEAGDLTRALAAVRAGAEDFLVRAHLRPGVLALSLRRAVEQGAYSRHLRDGRWETTQLAGRLLEGHAPPAAAASEGTADATGATLP